MATRTKSSKPSARTRKTVSIPRTPELDKSAKRTASKVQSNNLYPDSAFTVRGGIPQLSDDERDSRILAIHQQNNALKVAQENHKLDREIEVSKGLAIETQIQTAKNSVTAERLNTESVNLEIAQTQTHIQVEKLEGFNIKLEIEQTKNSISQAQLSNERIELKGEQGLLPYRQQLWDMRLENLALDVQSARTVLDNKIAQLGSRLSGGRN